MKTWYNIILENWSQIVVLIGAIGFIIKTITNYRLKRKEITFSRLQENKILEIKSFYKSYQALEIALRHYLNQINYGTHSEEIFSNIKTNIFDKYLDFVYNSMTVKLFLSSDEIVVIDDIKKILESIRVDLDVWLINNKSMNPPEGWENLDEIRNERFAKLPELIKKIETSLRYNLELK